MSMMYVHKRFDEDDICQPLCLVMAVRGHVIVELLVTLARELHVILTLKYFYVR